MRHDALQLARRFSCAFVVLHVTAALELCLQRDAQRSASSTSVASGAAVGADVVRNISASMELPDPAHCPWEKYTVAVTWPPDVTIAGESLTGTYFILAHMQ
jgi:hypothetical protein